MEEDETRILLDIDEVCERFEGQWRESEPPRAEDYLTDWTGHRRAILFRHLLELDLDYRRRRGERPTVAEYEERFPEFRGLITEVMTSPNSSPNGGPPTTKQPPSIGDYRIVREIGRGGMGIVYEAFHQALKRTVALKVLPIHASRDGSALERFRREARTAARLHHTNIVPVFDVGTDGEVCFYTMQLIEAQSLEVVRQGMISRKQAGSLTKTKPAEIRTQPGPLADSEPPGEFRFETGLPALALNSSNTNVRTGHVYRVIARIGLQVAGALQYAHDRGVIHRDIKPSNLLLDESGVVWVTDFGLAKTDEEGLTRTGDILGTFRYMSPERFSGTCDERGDIYGLGATLYELLTLEPLFESSDRMQLIERINRREPVPPRVIDPKVPRDLETIVLKALDKDPRRRYATARHMGDDLRRFLDDLPIRARRASAPERLARWARRNKALAASLTLVALLLIGITVAALVAAREFREQAEQEIHLRKEADDARERIRETLYYAQMNLAANTLDAVSGVEQLDEYGRPWLPEPGRRDLRGWEWFLVHAIGHSERTIIETGTGGLAIAWSPDGRLVASGYENRIGLWDPLSGRLVEEVRPDAFGPPASLAWSPDGSRLAAADGNGLVAVWDRATRRSLTFRMSPAADSLSREPAGGFLSWDPAGERLAFHGWRKTIRIRDLASGRDVAVLDKDIDSPPSSFGFSPDGKLFASHTRVGNEFSWDITVWDTTDWTERCRLREGNYPLSSLAWSPDGTRIAYATQGGHAGIWDVPTRTLSRRLSTTGALISSLAWSPDGTRLAASNWGLAIQVWDPASGRDVALLRGHTNKIDRVAWSPDSRFLASGASDGTLRIWDMSAPPPIRTVVLDHEMLPGDNHPYVTAVWNGDGSRLATSVGNMGTRLWDVRRWEPIETIQGVAMSWSCDDRLAVFIYGEDIMIRDQVRGGVLKQCTLVGQPKRFAWHPRRPHVLALRSGQALLMWDVRNQDRPVPVDDRLDSEGCLAWSPDGRFLATNGFAEDSGRVIIRDFEAPADVRSFEASSQSIRSLAWSPDGRFLAVGGKDTLIRLWDTSDLQPLRTLRGHTSTVPSVAWSPDGARLASAGLDGTVKVWDTRNGELAMSRTMPGAVHSVAWSPDGTRLVSLGEPGILTIWDATAGYRAAGR